MSDAIKVVFFGAAKSGKTNLSTVYWVLHY